MLVPQFKLSQSQQSVIVVLRLPYVKISSCQFYIEQHNFKFYLKPYLLSLTFQQALQQVEQPSKATYYHDKYLLQVHLKKKTKGQNFTNLNLLSSVINNKKSKQKNNKKVLVEVIGQNQQQIIKNNQNQINKNPYSYGFCNNYQKVFNGLEEQCTQIFSINPHQVKIDNRYQLSNQIVQSQFDQDAYLFDKYQNEQQIDRIIKSNQPQVALSEIIKRYKSKQPQKYQQFRSQLKIPNKQLIIGKFQQEHLMKQLISICFSYIYELICMEGDLSVESAKTINNTSAVLNCCMNYQNFNLFQVIKDCNKRCIVYSLYKSIQISQRVLKFLAKYLSQDLLCAIIVDLRRMFNKSEPRHLLNTIYIDDYLIYCIKSKIQPQIIKLRAQIEKIKLTQQQLKPMFSSSDYEENQSQQEIQVKKENQKPKQLVQVLCQTQNEQTNQAKNN